MPARHGRAASLLPIFASLILLVAGLPGGETSGPPALTEVALTGPAGLAAFAEKVRSRQPVTLAYIGGSITQGAGASEYGRNYYWSSQTAITKAIAGRGGSAKAITAAIGGTGSTFGAYRVGAQLLAHHPDLLVVEFAVNDCPGAQAQALAAMPTMIEGMEGIVRQALRANPRMGLVFLYTSSALFQRDYYAKGLATPSVAAHHQVAQRYGALEVMTGPAIAKGLAEGAFSEKAFFPDGTHPSDIGHALYAKALTDAIIPALDLPAPAAEPRMPDLLGRGSLEWARLDPIVPIGGDAGWAASDKQWNWYGVRIWTCDEAGKPLRFLATGTGIQFIHIGRLQVDWTVAGTAHRQVLDGRAGMPFPASWSFPPGANPDGVEVAVQAVAGPDGKAHGEVWGLFSVQKN